MKIWEVSCENLCYSEQLEMLDDMHTTKRVSSHLLSNKLFRNNFLICKTCLIKECKSFLYDLDIETLLSIPRLCYVMRVSLYNCSDQLCISECYEYFSWLDWNSLINYTASCDYVYVSSQNVSQDDYFKFLSLRLIGEKISIVDAANLLFSYNSSYDMCQLACEYLDCAIYNSVAEDELNRCFRYIKGCHMLSPVKTVIKNMDIGYALKLKELTKECDCIEPIEAMYMIKDTDHVKIVSRKLDIIFLLFEPDQESIQYMFNSKYNDNIKATYMQKLILNHENLIGPLIQHIDRKYQNILDQV